MQIISQWITLQLFRISGTWLRIPAEDPAADLRLSRITLQLLRILLQIIS